MKKGWVKTKFEPYILCFNNHEPGHVTTLRRPNWSMVYYENHTTTRLRKLTPRCVLTCICIIFLLYLSHLLNQHYVWANGSFVTHYHIISINDLSNLHEYSIKITIDWMNNFNYKLVLNIKKIPTKRNQRGTWTLIGTDPNQYHLITLWIRDMASVDHVNQRTSRTKRQTPSINWARRQIIS